MDLFCVIIKTPEDAFDVMMMLSNYDPLFTILTNYDDEPNSIVLVVHGKDGAFTLAETYCQMNMRQVGSMNCPVCEKSGEDICGHLTFNGIM